MSIWVHLCLFCREAAFESIHQIHTPTCIYPWLIRYQGRQVLKCVRNLHTLTSTK